MTHSPAPITNSARLSLLTPAIIATCCGMKAMNPAVASASRGRAGNSSRAVKKAKRITPAPSASENSRSGISAPPKSRKIGVASR